MIVLFGVKLSIQDLFAKLIVLCDNKNKVIEG